MTNRRHFLAALAGLAPTLWAEPRQRIISLSPTVTEILYGLGVFDRVVAVSEYCVYPPEVRSLPRVGGFQNPNLEKAVALRPDIVIMAESQAPFVQEKLTQLGLRTLLVPGQTIEQALAGIVTVGKATGSEQKGRELAAQTRAALEKVRVRASRLAKPSVLCVVDRPADSLRDLYTATNGSFLVELIAIAGGSPVTLPSKVGYGKIGKETLLTLNPDVILDLMQGSKGQSSTDPRQAWRDLPELKAVQTGRVFQIFEDFVPHASQRMAETAVIFAKRIHPEIAASEWGHP